MTTPADRGWRTSYGVRLALLVGVAVAVSGGVLAGATYLASGRTIDIVADRLFLEVSSRATERTRSHLMRALPTVQLAKSLLVGPRQPADQEDVLAALLRANPEFTWVSHSTDDGTFTGALRTASGDLRLSLRRRVDGKTVLDDYRLTPEGRALIRHDDDAGYDPRTRPFFQLAASRKRLAWTPPYVFFEQGVPGISCALPDLAADGRMRGVFAVDLDLNQLGAIVSQLRPSEHGQTFLYTADRVLLAHPSIRVVEQGSSGARLLRTDEVKDPVFQRFVTEAASRSGEALAPEQLLRPQTFNFSVNQADYFASADTFELEPGMRWIVGTITPKSDLTGALSEQMRRTLWMGVVLVLAAVLIAAIAASRLAQPLRQIAREMEIVGQFNLKERPLPRTTVREIALINRTLLSMKNGLRSFASYVPRDLVRAVIASGQETRLGGKVKELSIFFSDIANFTSFSETMKPDALVERLGVYLDEMTRIIGDEAGTVDKFIGDGIMAFWGAPQDLADHAYRACSAALKCQARLRELKENGPLSWMKDFHTRIGIATGEALVGNIGTPDRMNYTVIGDTVNLAARLEGLNKAYGSRILLGEATHAAVKDRVLARPLDVVAVKGKAQALRVFELWSDDPVRDEALKPRVELAERGLARYLARDFQGAMDEYAALLVLIPGDLAAIEMIARCEHFLRQPPPAEWNGTRVMTEK